MHGGPTLLNLGALLAIAAGYLAIDMIGSKSVFAIQVIVDTALILVLNIMLFVADATALSSIAFFVAIIISASTNGASSIVFWSTHRKIRIEATP
ncbi:hypothetical protein ACFL2B_03075 [Patescibacteria group bacterium]